MAKSLGYRIYLTTRKKLYDLFRMKENFPWMYQTTIRNLLYRIANHCLQGFNKPKSQCKETNGKTCVTGAAANKNDTNWNINHQHIKRKQSARSIHRRNFNSDFNYTSFSWRRNTIIVLFCNLPNRNVVTARRVAKGEIDPTILKSCTENFQVNQPLVCKPKRSFRANQRNCLRNLSCFSF